jgi:ABC-type polysaccharide/polyol phosphate transport system ATPase subunit
MIIDATGHENIYLRCAIMGLKPREIDAVVDDIVAFSELGITYTCRCARTRVACRCGFAFAVATCVAADIVLMDEWLSAGDASFAAKAQERLDGMLARAGIFVVATHDEGLIKRTCNKIMRLEHGNLVEFAAL